MLFENIFSFNFQITNKYYLLYFDIIFYIWNCFQITTISFPTSIKYLKCYLLQKLLWNYSSQKTFFVPFSFVFICKKPLEKRKIETDNITLRGLSLNYYFHGLIFARCLTLFIVSFPLMENLIFLVRVQIYVRDMINLQCFVYYE